MTVTAAGRRADKHATSKQRLLRMLSSGPQLHRNQHRLLVGGFKLAGHLKGRSREDERLTKAESLWLSGIVVRFGWSAAHGHASASAGTTCAAQGSRVHYQSQGADFSKFTSPWRRAALCRATRLRKIASRSHLLGFP